jgi:hypothetical protein
LDGSPQVDKALLEPQVEAAPEVDWFAPLESEARRGASPHDDDLDNDVEAPDENFSLSPRPDFIDLDWLARVFSVLGLGSFDRPEPSLKYGLLDGSPQVDKALLEPQVETAAEVDWLAPAGSTLESEARRGASPHDDDLDNDVEAPDEAFSLSPQPDAADLDSLVRA